MKVLFICNLIIEKNLLFEALALLILKYKGFKTASWHEFLKMAINSFHASDLMFSGDIESDQYREMG